MTASIIDRIDHFVLTVRDIDATCDFYQLALGMTREVFGAGRTALKFGRQKINLHPAGRELEPKALCPAPGGGDFCLITRMPIADVVRHLQAAGVAIELMPSPRTGATGPISSVYFRDPDGNLVEVSNYDGETD
ncbi:MAG: VOC family protein [Proteobacteria bacterium]|nr:VOC family protein [Pseudomonadota bacterium]